MPRVSNSAQDVANRIVEKSVALNAAFKEMREFEDLMKVSDPKSAAFRVASNAILRVKTDMESLAGSILALHQKDVTSDWTKFITDFCLNFALKYRESASVEKQKQFDDSFSSPADVVTTSKK